jgi:hypothetical protein
MRFTVIELRKENIQEILVANQFRKSYHPIYFPKKHVSVFVLYSCESHLGGVVVSVLAAGR